MITNSNIALLHEIEAFCARHGISDTAFGRLASRDGHLVRNLRAGRSISLSRADRIRAFMGRYHPDRDRLPPRTKSAAAA